MLSYTIVPGDLERELTAGETLLWNGRPRQGLMLRPVDALLIPFSLMWGGFALFWEAAVVLGGAPILFMLWGVPFLLVGLYMIVGRFFVDAALRARTTYAVTSQRVLLISGLFSRTVRSLPLQTLGEITLQERSDGSGTISFGPSMPLVGQYRGFAWPGVSQRLQPAFERIPDARQVHDLIRNAQRPA